MAEELSVVLVDKNPDSMQALSEVLQHELRLNKIHQTGTVEQAIDCIKGLEKVDWLITEVDLPNQTGFDLIQQVQHAESMQNAAIIVITETTDRNAILTAAALGAADFISKPYTMGALIIKLRKLLSIQYKRTSERVAVIEEQQATITFAGAINYTGNLLDISEGGCQLGVRQFDQGGCVFDEIDIVIAAPDGEIKLRGEIVRQERHPHATKEERLMSVAIQFAECDADTRTALDVFIKQMN